MRVRHAVLPTPSISLRLNQALSYTQIMRETPQIPFYVFNSLRTLSFSVFCNLFVCHSYENCRVCTNNSHSGTEHPIRMRVLSERSEPKDLSPSFASCATPATHQCTQVLSFHTLTHSFVRLQMPTPLFSSIPALFGENTGGGGREVLFHRLSYDLKALTSNLHDLMHGMQHAAPARSCRQVHQ